MNASQKLHNYVLRYADSCLVLSQRLTEWCGVAPELEEDVAISNVALDLLGQARLWLDYAGRLEGEYTSTGRDEDQLAFWRDPHEFRNLLLVELPNGNFADTQVRQFFFDAWHFLVLQQLQQVADPTIAGIAAKALKEVSYHLRRSSHWVVRLGDGTGLSHRRAQRAVDYLWDYVGELFEMDELDHAMLAQGTGVDLQALEAPWRRYVAEVLADATLALPDRRPFQTGGKQGLHSEYLGRLLVEMQFLQRAHPGAQW